MCNRYANLISYRQYVEEFSETRIPLLSPLPSRAPNLEPRDNVFPTETAPVLRPIERGLELAHHQRAQRGHHEDAELQERV